jgi:acetyl-CoA acetyltransferase
MSRRAVVAGYGETEYEKGGGRRPISYLADAMGRALADANLPVAEVDGLAATSFELDGHNVTTLAQHLGVSGRWLSEGSFGGASPLAGVRRGTRAIEAGDADVVVVVAADATSPDEHMEMMDEFNEGVRNNLTPYGFGGANGVFALLQRQHAAEHGTTREQLSEVAVAQREHARKNPAALLRDPLTTADYLDARPIVEPLGLYDCVLPCGGGGALVLTTEQRAVEAGADPVFLRAADEFHDPDPTEPFALTTGLRECKGVFESAGVARDDLDCVQIYDDYPIMVAIQLEDLGFCARGAGGRFVAETDLSFDGDLPLNTGGGQLSVGQAGAGGGILGPVEAVRQLRGEGGDRQVAGCESALATGFGMVGYGGGLSASVAVLSREPGPDATEGVRA